MYNFVLDESNPEETRKTLRFLLDHKYEFLIFETYKKACKKKPLSANLWRHDLCDETRWKDVETLLQDPCKAPRKACVTFITTLCMIYTFMHKDEYFKHKDLLLVSGLSDLTYYVFEYEGCMCCFRFDITVSDAYVSDCTLNGDTICIVESEQYQYLCTCGSSRDANEILKIFEGNTSSFKRALATGIYSLETLRSSNKLLYKLPTL